MGHLQVNNKNKNMNGADKENVLQKLRTWWWRLKLEIKCSNW